VLVWVRLGDGAKGWLWDGAAGLKPIELPTDWPKNADDIAWRPDGLALAASAGDASVAGGFAGTFVVAEIGGTRTTVVPLPHDYDQLEGWWSQTELRVGHAVCTEGCGGKYSWSARLRIRDHHLTELRAADRANGQIDLVSADSGSIVLSPRNEDPSDDIDISWPSALGPTDALDILGMGMDGKSVLVARREDAG